MITAILADDEAFARERLRELLERFGLFDILAEARDGNEALSEIVARKPDVAFLDINMPGVSVFSSLASLQNPPLVVFQTAYSEHAAKAFDIDALDYLLKPVRYERLRQTVERIKEALALRAAAQNAQPPSPSTQPAAQIAVDAGGSATVVAAQDISRISSEDGFCYVYARGARLMSDKYLSYYEDKLTGGRFFRISRTDLVNLEHVVAIHRSIPGLCTVELKDGARVDVSRRRAQILRTMVGL